MPNKGQVYDQYGNANKGVKYLYRQGPLQFQLRDKGFSYEIFRKKDNTENDWEITRLDLAVQYAGQPTPLQFDWQGADELDEVNHYYNQLGRFENLRRARNVTGVSKDKNVKLVFEVSADGKVKYDIWVKPSVAAQLRLSGHEQSRLLASNRPDKVSFVFFDDTIEESIPKVALMRNGAEIAMADAGWAQAENEQTLKIVLPEGASWRDADWMVIDPLPTLRWATYYGGSSNDQGYGSAATPDGEVVYCGKSASSSNIASIGAYKTTNSGKDDAFIVKMKRNGGSGQRVWGTYFGGTLEDVANDVAVDLNGDVLVTGVTNSSGLGVNARYKSTYAANKDAIIIKFSASGTLLWSNYLGGTADDEGLGIATDSLNNVIVVGKTESSGITSNATGYTVHQSTNNGNGDGFIAKLDKDGNRFFVTYYGGTAGDDLDGVVTSRKDTIVVVGTTSSASSIAPSGTFQGNAYSSLNDAYIVKLTATGTRVHARYYGDIQNDYGYNVYYKASNYFLVGKTNSDKNISTTGSHQLLLNSSSTFISNTDGYLVKFSPNFNRLWSTYYGGTQNDDAMSMVIDDFDYIYVCGTTGSSGSIATSDAYQKSKSGGADAYIVKFSNLGKRIWGTYFGGMNDDAALDIAHGKFADVFFVGITESDTNLVKYPFQATYGQATDAYFGDLYYCKKYALLRKDTVCLNDTFSIKFTDSSNKNNWNRSFNKYRFLWTGPNNFSLPGNKPYNLQTARRKALWKDTGIYQLIVTDSFGCKDTARIRINYFYPLPIDTIQSSKNYCKWDTIKFKATAGPWARSNYQFYWRSLDNVFKSGNNRDTLRYPALKGKSDGRYELRIKDHLGCSSLDTFFINVGPTATLSSNSPICPKGSIDLKATGSRLKKVVWKGPNNYLDSGISVKILNADKSKMGKYTAIVTDSSNCKDTLTITTILFQLDSLLITRNAPVCAGDTLKITASMRSVTSRYSFKWTGPSSFVSTTRFVVISKPTTANGGTYKLEVTDNASGCVLDTSISITIRSLPIASITTNSPVCEGGRFTIRSYPSGGGGSGYQFTWTTPKGTTRTDTGLIFNPVTRADSGTYRLRLKDVNGCTKDTSIVFALKMLPDVGFTPNKDSQCLKSATFTFTNTTVLTSGTFQNFTWKTQNFTDTLLTNKNAISRKYTSVGKYKVTLIAKSNDGCVDSLTKYVGVYPEPTLSWDIVSNDTQCLKRNAFEFDDKSTISKGTLTRFWTFGDGGKSSADPAKYSYTTAGDFTVKLKVVSGYGCSDSSTKKVRVNDNPKASISVNSSTQCFSGNRFIFTDVSTISAGWKMNGRKWNIGSGFADTTKKDTASFSSAGNFTVSLAVISADGCTDTAKTIVTVQSTPTAGAIGSDQTICNGGNPVAFTSATNGTGSGTITYRWESSTNSGASWTTVTGATGATYDVPAGLTTTTQYRRITISTQNSVPCESAATTPVTVNVQSVVAAGVIGSSQTICNGGDPVAFTSTTAGNGSGTITYRWESSTNGGSSWTTITGATSDIYDVPAGLTTTTLYRRITISTLNAVPCESVATSPVTVTVQNVVTAGVISSSQTICDGGNPALFTSTTNGTGSGPITYRWEASTNSGLTWTTVTGATGATYDVPAGLTTTTQYRRITISTLNGVPCESVATTPVTVTVQSPVTAGAVGSDQTICNGGNPAAFTSTTNGTGSGTITYRWESSTNSGASWTTVTGATGATYDVPAGLTTTTQYRRITISTLNSLPCESVATTPVIVTVQSAVTAGAISSSQTICNGGDPVAFTSTTAGSGSGTITYRWESSTNGGATWSPITGATGTTYDEPAGLTTTTHFRRVTISTLNLVPCETPTSAVIVTVQSIVTAGAIGSDQTICGGGNPAAFTSTTAGSGSGTITYRWESSTNSGATWTTVTGATGATYDVPAGLTTTTQYRRITISTLNGVPCESAATTAVTVTVQGSATAGAIGSDQTICNGGNPSAFTNLTAGSGSGTITYRWESSTNGGSSWTTITGATDSIYDAPSGLTTTTHYRRVTISTLNLVPCETATSAVMVTVQSIVTAGAISSSQTICDGGNPAAFTSATNGAGSGTITYRWESSSNSGATWTTVTGATGATYDVPAGLTTTSQYRRVTISTQNTVACESGTTSILTVTVQTVPTIGAIGSDQTICNGGDPVAFTSTTAGSGSGTITYRWESSTNSGATWTTVTGATGATYDVPAGLTITTQYRRITISTLNGVPCESGSTSAVIVTVQSAVTAGTISSSQTICNGGDPVAFTSTTAGSGSGTITYRWESSTNGGASWSTISGATTDVYDVPAGLTTTTLYRRVAISTLNSIPCESATVPVTVTVQSVVTEGVIGSSQTICNGGDPVAFTSTTAGSGSGTITYRWESSTNSGATWTTVTGATGATYDVAAGLSTTTQYRRITISTQNSVPCESGATTAVTVTVQGSATAGAIGSNQTICNGGDPVAFTSTTAGSGSGTITYRWESSTNGGTTWTTIAGATADVYDVPAGLTTTTHYRRVTISTLNSVPCETATSAVIVTVQSSATAGAISSSQTICNGGDPVAFTSTTAGSGTGTVTYRWESSTSGGASWTTVTGATGATYDVPAGLTTTTQYRRITISTQNGVPCESVATTPVTVTVQSPVLTGVIGSDQTICSGGDPVAFTSTTAGSGSGTITYRWESSTNGGATWTSVTGATGATYDVPAGLTTTTQYRRITISTLNAVPCESAATSVVTVTVQSAVTAGAISSNQTICNGGDPVVFTSTVAGSGSGTITYRWESSINGGATWTTVTGATGATYDVPVGLTTTTLYRRVAISTLNSIPCESATAPVTVTVRNVPTAGVIASDQTICNGGDPAAFTSTSAGTGDGSISYRWESSTNGGVSWSTIPGVTGTTYDVPAGLTITTQYRRITLSTVSSLTCESNAAKAITVTVQSAPGAGLVGSDTTICSGDDPVAFTSKTAGSGDGTITYRWESSTNGGVSWATIPGITTAIYDVPAGLTVSSQYRRITISTLNAVACESNATAVIKIKVNPLPTATAFSNSPVCTRGKLSLRSNGGNTYEWFGPNGFKSKKQDTIIYKVDSSYLGNYTVWVTDANKCKDDFTIKVDVKPGFTIAAWTNSPVCTNDTLKFFGATSSYVKSTYIYEWVSKSFFSTVQNPVIDKVDSSRDGVYRFVAISANGCTDTTTTTPTILRPPLIKFVTNSPECVGQKAILYNAFKSGTSFTWRKPNGATVTTDTLKIASLKISDAGFYRLTVIDSRGCRNQDSIKYTVNALPKITVSGDSKLCTGSTLKLNVTGTLNYKWTGPNGFLSFLSNPTRASVTMPDSGLYMVIGTDINKCRDTAKWNVMINPAIPGLKIFGDSQVCRWEKLTLTTIANTKNYRYKWLTPNGEVHYNPKLVIPLNKHSYEGVYSVVVSDSNYNCKDSVTDYVWVGPRPMSDSSNSPVCAGDTLKLNAYGNSRWTWQWSGPLGFTSTSTNPKLAYVNSFNAGTYQVIGTDTLGCRDTLTENVKINDCMVIELYADSVKCKGASTGLARVVAMGGSGFYQYKWLTSPARFNDTLKNIPKGTYTVVVTDLKTGIVRIDSVKVGEPANVLSASIVIDSLVCRDSSNAKLTCKASGGTTPYAYKWNGNVLLNNFFLQNVGSGSHSLVVTDRRGCMDTADVTVVNPKRWVITKSRDNVLCAGGNTGQASIVVSGGKPAYFYQWDTVTWVSRTKGISSVYKNLKAGIYKVLITDANNCQQTDTVMIAQPDSIKLSFTIDNYIRCYGDTSGQITSFPKGGVSGYTYLWNYNKKYTARVAKNLPAGWYVLQLRDGNNCLKIDSILLSQPDDIKTKVSVLTHLKCYKDKSGAAEVSVTGGVTPYYVKWDNGGYTAQGFARNYMDAGDHWVYIRDFQGCYDTLKLTLNQPDSIITLFKTRRDVLCYNGNTGWAEFELAGGTAPFRYVWENGDTTKRATGLQATSYWMRAVDSNGCKHTDTIQMAQPPELDVYVKRMDSVTCFGLSDGRAELSAVGGKKPYGFWYFTGKDTIKGPNLTGVSARQFPAKYDGYVRDSNGCVDYTPVFIKEPSKLQVQRNGQVELICYGAATASVAVGPMGGNGGYTYSWNSFPKQYTSTATKLKAGVYVVTLKDYKGCTALDTFTIKQPAKNPIVTNPNREFCLKRTMNLTAAQFGADTAWWYSPAGLYIGNAYPTFTKPNVTLSDSGNYTLIVKDKQGCNDTAKIKVIVHKLPVVSAWIQQPAPHCKSDTITFRSSGAVNYNWNGPNGFMSSVQNPVISGLTLPMDGWYYVQGTDNNTCQSRDSVRLDIENNISISKNQDVCAGTNLVLSGFGAEKYRWAGPHGYGSTLQSPILLDVEDSMTGRYTLFARDKFGCKDTLFTDILIYPRPYLNPAATEPVCAGEPLSLFSKGGGNYQYTWTGPLGYSSTSANPVFNTSTQSQTGNYNLYASYQADATNICRDSAFVYAQVFGLPVSAFMLTPKSAVYLTETEYELVDYSKNAVSWTYYMDDNYLSKGPNTKFTLSEAGVRVFKQVVQSKDISVYSGGYCTDSSDQVVKIEYKPKLWMPNAFTPNNNNKNDLLYPTGVNITEYRLRIFDRWGNKIFDEPNGKWSGYDASDKPYPVGVYVVYVTYKDITGLERELKNNVTLIR